MPPFDGTPLPTHKCKNDEKKQTRRVDIAVQTPLRHGFAASSRRLTPEVGARALFSLAVASLLITVSSSTAATASGTVAGAGWLSLPVGLHDRGDPQPSTDLDLVNYGKNVGYIVNSEAACLQCGCCFC